MTAIELGLLVADGVILHPNELEALRLEKFPAPAARHTESDWRRSTDPSS